MVRITKTAVRSLLEERREVEGGKESVPCQETALPTARREHASLAPTAWLSEGEAAAAAAVAVITSEEGGSHSLLTPPSGTQRNGRVAVESRSVGRDQGREVRPRRPRPRGEVMIVREAERKWSCRPHPPPPPAESKTGLESTLPFPDPTQ